MPKKVIASTIPSYINSPCDRCGSPKMIGKTWKENIETFNGKSTIEHTQILCSNKECQKDYDKKLIEDAKKREALKAGNPQGAINKKAVVLEASKSKGLKSKTS